MAALIYKVLTAQQFASVEAGGPAQAPVDLTDGFVHLSTSRQVQETLARHFHGQSGLVVAGVDPAALGETLRWEISRGGDAFPHVYGEIGKDHIVAVWAIDQADAAGCPIAPAEVTSAPEPAAKPVRAS